MAKQLAAIVGVFFTSCLAFACSTPKTPTPTNATPLINSFEFSEITETPDEAWPVPDQSIVNVDINSKIQVHIDTQKLVSATAPADSKKKLRNMSAERQALLATLESIKGYIALSKEVNRLYAATHDDQGRVRNQTSEEYKTFKSLFPKQGRIGSNILKQTKLYLSERYGLPRLEVSQWLVDNNYEIDSPKNPSLARLLKDEIKNIDDETRARADLILKGAKKVKLRLRANLVPQGKPTLPFHIPGYDNLEAGDPRIVDKTSFQLDKEDREKLEKEVQFNSDLAGVINDMRDETSDLRVALTETLNRLARGFDDIKGSLDRFEDDFKRFVETYKHDRASVVAEIKKLSHPLPRQPLTDEAKANLKKIQDNLGQMEGQIQRIKESVESVRNKARSLRNLDTTTPSLVLVDLAQNMPSLESFLSEIRDLESGIKGLTDSLREVSQSLENIKNDQRLTDGIKNRIVETLKSRLKPILESATPVEAQHQQELARIVSLVETLYSAYTPLVRIPDATSLDAQAIDVPLDEIKDTELHITRTPRKEGDLVEFTAQVMSEDGEVLDEGSRLFRVTKFGLHTSISANVIFVNRLDPPLDGRKVSWVASPAVSYSFHYRTRAQDSWGKFWNVLDPGFGLNTTLLNFEGSQVQVGLGATGSLFGDILQGGFGYNLQAESGKEYVFIGIGIFETVDAVKQQVF